MSAHGISPTWVQNSPFKFGNPWVFDPEVLHVLIINCDIAFLGDINPEISFSVTCEIVQPPPNFTHTMTVGCDTTFLGDVNPQINMNNILVVVVATS